MFCTSLAVLARLVFFGACSILHHCFFVVGARVCVPLNGLWADDTLPTKPFKYTSFIVSTDGFLPVDFAICTN